MRKILIITITIIFWTSVYSQNSSSFRKKIEFYQPNYDTIKNLYEIEIESENYLLEILFYSLNDSLVPKQVVYENIQTGRLTDSVTIMTHNNQGKVNIWNGNNLVFSKLIDKTILIDTLPNDFYEESTIFELQFVKIEKNKIHFSSMIGHPDSEWFCYVNFSIGLNDKIWSYNFPKISDE